MSDEDNMAMVTPIRPMQEQPKFRYQVLVRKYSGGPEIILHQSNSMDHSWFVFEAALRGKKYSSVCFHINHPQ